MTSRERTTSSPRFEQVRGERFIVNRKKEDIRSEVMVNGQKEDIEIEVTVNRQTTRRDCEK